MQQSEVGLQKITLKNLTPDINNALIVGIIIAKSEPKKFNSKDDSTTDRAVWNFTLRDSLQDYINATFWGSSDHIYQFNDKFQIGDVVDVIKPRIEIRKINDYGEQFRPMVTSPYTLLLGDQSLILSHEGDDFGQFLKLMNYPTKPLAGFVTLANVKSKVGRSTENFVDLLGAVRLVCDIRSIKTKEGQSRQVREVIIFDHTSQGLRFALWNPELIIRAGNWKPRTTLLFLTDMRIEWSKFHKNFIASFSMRSVITEDPIGSEADALRSYALTATLESSAILDQMVTSVVDPNSIQHVMNIQQVNDKIELLANSKHLRPDEQQFTGLLYAFVTHFDLDGFTPVVTTRCASCNTRLENATSFCDNLNCPVGNKTELLYPITTFDIRLTLSDHTGSLENCRLSNKVAETVLQCDVQQFLHFNEEEKCTLKWKYLLERCAVRIMVNQMEQRRPIVSILSCTVASPHEAANRLTFA